MRRLLEPLLISDDMIEDAAASVRTTWHVPAGPIDNMIGLLEYHGIFVFMMPLGADTLDALSVDWNERHPYVIIGTDQGNTCRWRFDCAHELGHLILHRGIDQLALSTPVVCKLIEMQAHRFASALLLPEQEFVQSLYTVSLDGYHELKPYWKVSIAAMVRRTRDLSIISEDGYRNLCISISRRKWRRVEPFDEEMAPERPALASKGLGVLSNSLLSSEDEFMKATALPDDFMMTLFNGYRRSLRQKQAQVIQMPRRTTR
jgi:Zn-dependent peptidase ImmA (M78 family)